MNKNNYVKKSLDNEIKNKIFNIHIEPYKINEPWLLDIKKNHWNIYCKILLNDNLKEESWRFTKKSKFNFEDYQVDFDKTILKKENILERSNLISNLTNKIVIADNQVIYFKQLKEDLLSKGVIWKPLSQAIKENPDLIKTYLLKNFHNHQLNQFFNLNTSLFNEGIFLYIPKDIIIDNPFVVYNWTSSDKAMLFPRTIIVAEKGSKVSFIDIKQSQNNSHKVFLNEVNTIIAKENSNINYQTIQNYNKEIISLNIQNYVLKRNSSIDSTMLNIGGSLSRIESKTYLKEEGSSVKINSLTVANNKQEFDQRTYQLHEKPNAFSNLLYKNVLLNNAKTIFSGLIRVEKNANKTDAYQTNRNLLLSPKANSISLPGLEIESNDVKCSHGSTSSMINEKDLFYFQSRGISKKLARELLIFGFCNEIINKFGDSSLIQEINFLIKESLN